MAKPRNQKLKVFRTPIGFHDAYVAAPSQKAALEAWGADSNLFAQGIAEQVTESELMKEPLERPGEVIRRLRGSAKEQVAALGRLPKVRARKAGTSKAAGKAKAKKPPKPSRVELDKAEEALEAAQQRHRSEVREMDSEVAALERRRRDLLRRHERERDELAEERDDARERYERAMRAWEKG
jgi:hypothetical protein